MPFTSIDKSLQESIFFLHLFKPIPNIMSKEKSPPKEKEKKVAKLSLKEKRAAKKEKREGKKG
jgi:hypothetical protein